MSDREDNDNREMQSPMGSMSDRSEGERKIVTYRSRSKERSASRSQTPVHKRKRKYSRSRSRSRSDHVSSSRRRSSRSRYRSRSRSQRRYKSSKYSRSRSASRSRSPSDSPYRSSRRYRSHSRSPMSNRRRHNGSRENPQPSRCLGVFGLSIYTTEQQIHHIFSKYGPVERVQVVIDAKTGRSRGFCFVYFENYDDARLAKDQCTGMEIDGRKIRVDYSITQRAHTPTPGIYMGKPTYTDDRWRRDRDYGDYYGGSYRYRRSPSPYYRRRRYDRSRSRSYTPRRY